MVQTLYHRLILPADTNHKNTLYAGSLLRLALEAGYATAWKHVGPQANLVLCRVLNLSTPTSGTLRHEKQRDGLTRPACADRGLR